MFWSIRDQRITITIKPNSEVFQEEVIFKKLDKNKASKVQYMLFKTYSLIQIN